MTEEKRLIPQIGDRVTFGRYQRGVDGNGLSPIEWQVLEVTDTSVLLISASVIDVMPFELSEK